MTELCGRAKRASTAALAGILAVGFFLTFGIAHYLYVGTSRAGIPFDVTAFCGEAESSASACALSVQELGYGRKRLTIEGPEAGRALLTLQPHGQASVLLVGTANAPNATGPDLQLALLPDSGARLPFSPVSATPARRIIPLPADAHQVLRILVEAPARPGPVVVDEIGLFRATSDTGPHWFLSADPKVARMRTAAALTVLLATALLASVFPGRWSAGLVAIAIGLAGSLAFLMVLAGTHGPDWAKDLRTSLAAGALLEPLGMNANYGIGMAQSILQGNGPLIAGTPPWNRMPGYGYVVAASAPGGDLLKLAVNSIFLTIVATGTALGLLTRALGRLSPLWVAAVIGAVLVILPKPTLYTQIEGFIQVPAFLVLAAGCWFIAETERWGRPGLVAHLLLHLAFAFWFAIRVDVLPGWAIVSLLLYGYPPRRWAFLLIPLGLAAAVALPWALFKQPFIHEFSPTTNSFGAGLLVGQWEVPHPFAWTANDEAYARWARIVGLDPSSRAASDAAVREVLRFWLIFPGYLVALVWHEFTEFWTGQIAFGQRIFSSFSFQHDYPIATLTVVLTAIGAWHRPLRLLLLGWILFFNVPLFFVIYSSGGRFYAPGLISLTVLSLLLALDRQFYRDILRRPLRSGLAAALGLGIFLFGQRLDDTLIAADRFRFATPFTTAKDSHLILYAAPGDEPVLEPERIGEQLDLSKLAAADGATAIARGAGDDLSRPGPGLLAEFPLPAQLATFHHCRLRLDLTVRRGAIAAGIRAPGDRQLLAALPKLGSRDGGDALDFNIPIDAATAGESSNRTLLLHAAAPEGGAATLHSIQLYRCGR